MSQNTLLTRLISVGSYGQKEWLTSFSHLFFPPTVFSGAFNSLSLSLLSPCLSSSSSPHLPNWFSCILSSAPKWANRRTAHRRFKALLLIYTALFLFCFSPGSSLSLSLYLTFKLVSMLYALSSTLKTEGYAKHTHIHTTGQFYPTNYEVGNRSEKRRGNQGGILKHLNEVYKLKTPCNRSEVPNLFLLVHPWCDVSALAVSLWIDSWM